MSTDEVAIGLISAPGSATEIASILADDLHAELSLHLPTVQWRVPTVVDALVHPPSDDAALVAAARDRLLKEGLGSGRLPHRLAAEGSPATGGGSREPSARRGCRVPTGARRCRTASDAPVTRSSGSCAPCSGTRRTTPSRAVSLVSDAAPASSEGASSRRGRQRDVHRESPQREPATTDRNDPGQPAVETCDRTLESADRRSGNGGVRPRHPRHLAAERRARLDPTLGDRDGVCRRDHGRADRRGWSVGTRVASGRS